MTDHERRTDWTAFAAIALIALGVWFLLGNVFGSAWQDAIRTAIRLAWPVALIALGVLVYVAAGRRTTSAAVTGRRLYRSRSDRMLSGVLAGVGDYFGIDSTIVRIVYVVFGALMGVWPAIVVYVVASIVIPEEPLSGTGSSAETPGWPQQTVTPPSAPPAGGSWPQGWPHTGTETVQTPAPAPPAPQQEPPADQPADE